MDFRQRGVCAKARSVNARPLSGPRSVALAAFSWVFCWLVLISQVFTFILLLTPLLPLSLHDLTMPLTSALSLPMTRLSSLS